MTDTATVVRRYAERFHARFLDEHGVASALGLWLLLALLAPAAEGDARRAVEAELGCDADDAARRAAALLRTPHPAVRAAVATWANPDLLDDRHRDWTDSLGADVETGPIPSQAAADAWADHHTDGMIERFPVALRPDTAMVLASALATDVSWCQPFIEADPEVLGGAFGAQIRTALLAPAEHTQLLVETDAAGIVALHTADAAAGLQVVSVLAGEAVPIDRVHAAALEVAAQLDAVRREQHGAVDVFDLPLGDGAAWSIDEHTIEVMGGGGDRRVDRRTYLAPWSAESDHDLAGAPGLDAAYALLESFLLPSQRPGVFDSRQAAVAEYTRVGFRAAAVTAVAMRAGFAPRPSHTVTVREVTVRFNRPYAVIAVAAGQAVDEEQPGVLVDIDEPAWAGLPVFAAWVAVPADRAD